MSAHTPDKTLAIRQTLPKFSPEQADFEQLAKAVDPFIAGTSDLAGPIIETPVFPGWSSFGAPIAHLRLVRDHHRQIRKIALVTDSRLGNMAGHMVFHFVAAETAGFPASGPDPAKQWIPGRPDSGPA